MAPAASATPVTEKAQSFSKIDTTGKLLDLIKRYQRRQRPISVNFRQLLPALNSADRFTHLIHPYPAKLLVHIPVFFLSNDLLSRPGDLVLDPFCGSGTVLLEAQAAGRQAYGVDSNPLARLIARVKTTCTESRALKGSLTRLLKNIPSMPSGPAPDVINVDHWFYPATQRQLQCLFEAVNAVSTDGARDFFRVCFSVCVRKVSLADPRLAVPVRLREGQYPSKHPLRERSDAHLRKLRTICVADVFERVALANIGRIERTRVQQRMRASVEVVSSDARRLQYEFSLNDKRDKPVPDESVQLIITSPPYPGAQKYIRSCSLSLGWLALCPTSELRAYKGRTIGREEFAKAERDAIAPTGLAQADTMLAKIRKKSLIRAAIAATYLNEMRQAIGEMSRVLKSGGHLVLVAANNRISGREFRTVDYLRAIAEACGLSLTGCFIDAIRSRGLMTKRNHTASVITREWVLVLTKGGLPQWMR